MAGSFIRAGAEWLAFAAVALMDLWLLAILAPTSVPRRPAVAVILATHAVCTWVATWWARRARDGDRLLRAKATETGWVLTGGWLIIALLAIASIGQRASLLLPDPIVVQVLVIAAVVAVLTGRSKYIDAREAIGTQVPRPDRLSLLGHRIARHLPMRLGIRERRSHLAVIEPTPPGPLTVVAGGTKDHCTSALEAWIEEHGLPEGARGWIVKPIAETVFKRGIGIYTRPITAWDSDALPSRIGRMHRWAQRAVRWRPSPPSPSE